MNEKMAVAPIRGIRRLAFIVAIVSLVFAALIGIFMILSGDLDETRWRVMATTLIVGAFCILALADLTVIGRNVGWLGWIGVLITGLAGVLSVVLVWVDGEIPEAVYRVLATTSIIAVALAVTCLLLLLARRGHSLVRVLLPIEVALIGVATLLLVLPAATGDAIPGEDGDWYWRLFWIVMILAVLGAVVLPIVGLITRGRQTNPAGGLSVQLPADLAEVIAARAASVGRSPADYVIDTLRSTIEP